MMMLPHGQPYGMPGLRVGGTNDGGMTYELSLPATMGGQPFASVTLYPMNVPLPPASGRSSGGGHREKLVRPSADEIQRRRSASVMSVDGGASPMPGNSHLIDRIYPRPRRYNPYDPADRYGNNFTPVPGLTRSDVTAPSDGFARPSSRASYRSNGRPFSAASNRSDATVQRTMSDGYYPRYGTGANSRIPVGEYKALPTDMKRQWFSEAPEEIPAALSVQNLQLGTTAEDLQAVFAEYGNIKSVELLSPNAENKSTGALVIMASRSEADLAVEKMNGCTADGLVLSVERVNPQLLARPFAHSKNSTERVVGNPPREREATITELDETQIDNSAVTI